MKLIAMYYTDHRFVSSYVYSEEEDRVIDVGIPSKTTFLTRNMFYHTINPAIFLPIEVNSFQEVESKVFETYPELRL